MCDTHSISADMMLPQVASGQNDDIAAGSSQHDQSNADVLEPPMQSHSQQEDKVDNMEMDIEANTAKRTTRQKTHSQKAHVIKKRLSTGEGPSKILPKQCCQK